MRTLYLCGASNPEGVRLALVINRLAPRWERVVLLDDDPVKQGKRILGVEVAGPLSLLGQADPAVDEVANLVARTTTRRQAVRRKLLAFGLPFARLIDPRVDTEGVEYGRDITIYQNVSFCAGAVVGEAGVVFTGAVVGHGCRIGPGCVIAPGAVINARVELGEGVYVGTNASILPDLKIGAWATIGANSAVVQDVAAGATVMGVPAQILMPSTALPEQATVAPAPSSPAEPIKAPEKPIPTTRPSGALQRLREAQQKFLETNRS